MLYKYCVCGKKIEYIEGKCIECKAKEEVERRERYKRYRDNRTDDKEQRFYNSKIWKSKRDQIISKYNYMSVYSYYTTGLIIPADVVHHILQLKKNWSKRIDNYNLFPLTYEEHKIIHRRINEGHEEEVIKELKEMLERFREEFNINLD